MKKLKSFIGLLVAFLLITSDYARVEAYMPNGFRVVDPMKATYYVDSYSLNQYVGVVSSYATQWNSCPEINLSMTYGNSDITLIGALDQYKEAYAKTSVDHNTQTATVRFYGNFRDLSTTLQQEVVVHELGHCFGLDHTQSSKESISVMGIYFNNKPYPLSDDKAGISFIY